MKNEQQAFKFWHCTLWSKNIQQAYTSFTHTKKIKHLLLCFFMV